MTSFDVNDYHSRKAFERAWIAARWEFGEALGTEPLPEPTASALRQTLIKKEPTTDVISPKEDYSDECCWFPTVWYWQACEHSREEIARIGPVA
ncbi:MAG: hypothetical protein NTZ87_02570 [Candidatus Nomurabacteria bacterium]|nr:hypothetical protein [Candidatus Nomurabacteria bacterium]